MCYYFEVMRVLDCSWVLMVHVGWVYHGVGCLINNKTNLIVDNLPDAKKGFF
jgi:hypothetical protein